MIFDFMREENDECNFVNGDYWMKIIDDNNAEEEI